MECKFKPYDKVLVRDYDSNIWRADFFNGDFVPEFKGHCQYGTIGSGYFHQCIPYEGNEYLLNTSNNI